MKRAEPEPQPGILEKADSKAREGRDSPRWDKSLANRSPVLGQ